MSLCLDRHALHVNHEAVRQTLGVAAAACCYNFFFFTSFNVLEKPFSTKDWRYPCPWKFQKENAFQKPSFEE